MKEYKKVKRMIEDIASHHSRLDCEPDQNKIVVEPPLCSCHTALYIIPRYLFTTYFNTKHTLIRVLGTCSRTALVKPYKSNLVHWRATDKFCEMTSLRGKCDVVVV